jgi:uncharacterized protein (DUF697 family)
MEPKKEQTANYYEEMVMAELAKWKIRMQRRPSLTSKLSRKVQNRINQAIPEKIHVALTTAIKQMTRAVFFGAAFTTASPLLHESLEQREFRVHEKIKIYRNTAAAEGAITGAGGILLGLADFPLWLTIKMKMLFEIAALYGYHVNNYKERLFLLYIFELTFSSQQHRNTIFHVVEDWENYQKELPDDINGFDWRSFQQEYRDFIDIAKLLQLIPGIGAAVGAVVNYRLTTKLGKTAINVFRMRSLMQKKPGVEMNTRPLIS